MKKSENKVILNKKPGKLKIGSRCQKNKNEKNNFRVI
jgi:hypothetical protein